MSFIHRNPSSKAKMSKRVHLINSSRRIPPMSLMAMEEEGSTRNTSSIKNTRN
ncbi:hypothetical protein C356_02781 [Cryptococcus neoformans c45]|nr:hypothetical protein C356_02781 [Cryptococcus neoformans var. grubii c45]